MSYADPSNEITHVMQQPQVKRRRSVPTEGASGDSTDIYTLRKKFARNTNKRVAQLSCRKFTLPTDSSESKETLERQQLLAETIQQMSTPLTSPNNVTPTQQDTGVLKACSQSVKGVRKKLQYSVLRRSASADEIFIKNYNMKSIPRSPNKKLTVLSSRFMEKNEINVTEQDSITHANYFHDNENTDSNVNVRQAARRVAFILMLHAWRQCRALLTNMFQQSDKLEAQIHQQKLQLAVLRELINTDNERIAAANEAAKKADEALTLAKQNEENERNEKRKLEEKILMFEQKIEEYLIDIKNCHNSMKLLQSDIATFEAQLNKEKEKVTKLEEDKKQLKEMLKETEVKLKQQDIETEKFKLTHIQLKKCINEQKEVNTSYLENIKHNESLIKNLQNKNLELEYKIEDQTLKLLSKQTEIVNLNTELNLTRKDVEILHERNNELELKLHETEKQLQEQYQRSWWSLAAELASGPASALRTMVRITLPALSYTPSVQSSENSIRDQIFLNIKRGFIDDK